MMIKLEPSLYDKVYWVTEKWMCSHCSTVTYNHKDMLKHESQCELNPENKNCRTCDTYCKIQPGGGYGCRLWKNVKFERTKKLTLLKNKMIANGVCGIS